VPAANFCDYTFILFISILCFREMRDAALASDVKQGMLRYILTRIFTFTFYYYVKLSLSPRANIKSSVSDGNHKNLVARV
jgi:hypothetical protein